MIFIRKTITALAVLGAASATAVPPEWWVDRVGITGNGDPKSVVTVGQLKNMAFHLNEELKAVVPEVRSGVGSYLLKPENPTAEWYEEQKKIANIGQLKFLAKIAYDRLNFSEENHWMYGQMSQNGLSYPFGDFPWDPNTPASENYKPVTIGQLKLVYSLRVRQDNDGDGVPDLFEYYHYPLGVAGDPTLKDTDFDGLTDIQEFRDYSTIASRADSDGDGMKDGWEVSNGLNPNDPYDASLDSDSDGLVNLVEFQLGSNAQSPDSDSDGLHDAWEAEWGFDLVGSADRDLDYDGDSIPNIAEFQNGTNPLRALRRTIIDLPDPRAFNPSQPEDSSFAWEMLDVSQDGSILLGQRFAGNGGVFLKAKEVAGQIEHEVIVLPSADIPGRVWPTHILSGGDVMGSFRNEEGSSQLAIWKIEGLDGSSELRLVGYELNGFPLDVSQDGSYILLASGSQRRLLRLNDLLTEVVEEYVLSEPSGATPSGSFVSGSWSKIDNNGVLFGAGTDKLPDLYATKSPVMIVADISEVMDPNFNVSNHLKRPPTPTPFVAGPPISSSLTFLGDPDSGYLGIGFESARTGPLGETIPDINQAFGLVVESGVEEDIFVPKPLYCEDSLLDIGGEGEVLARICDASGSNFFRMVQGGRLRLSERKVLDETGGSVSYLRLKEVFPSLGSLRLAGGHGLYGISGQQLYFFDELN